MEPKLIKIATALILILCFSNCYSAAVAKGAHQCPTLKLKRQWGGRPAKELTYQVRPIKYVIFHHTVTSECSTFLECSEYLQNIQNYNMDTLGLDDISYNFLIGNDGVVYEGTGWGVRGSHTYGYNMNGTGIAFIGTYTAKLPSVAALNVAKLLIACGIETGELDRHVRLLAASQVLATQSPGLTLYNEIQNWEHWAMSP